MTVTDGVDNTQEEQTQEPVENTTEKNTKEEEAKRTYTDEEVNAISLKNSDKAVKKFMKDLGINDVEKAKEILAKAREEEAANTPESEKINQIKEEVEKARIEAINLKIENALLQKGIGASKAERLKRLVDKKALLDEEGELENDKLNSEVEALLKEFPELTKKEDEKKGFIVGSDGKEEKKESELDQMKKIMGLV